MSGGGIDYAVFTYGESAQAYDLTPAVIDIEWGDPEGELAARAVITLAAVHAGAVDIARAAMLNSDISIIAGGARVFTGVIWDYTLTDGRYVRLICYDRLIYLTGSRDSCYFAAGSTTESVADAICSRWDMPLRYTYAICRHPALSYRSMTVAQQLTRTLDAAHDMCGERYMLRMEGDTLHIGRRGESDAGLTITRAAATGYTHRSTMNGLVTRVAILTGGTDGPVKTGEVLDGDTALGVLQEVVDAQGVTHGEAREQAELLLKERGAPGETISVQCIDSPALRRGDMVRIETGSLSGGFDVLSVMHSSDGMMRLSVARHDAEV